MSIYNRDEIAPEWEPAPWTRNAKKADEQERGFHERAMKPISWQPIPWKDFPPEGIFSHQKEWFSSADVEFFASVDGEDLLLMRNIWFGWPDPLEWGLASRPTGRSDIKWARWGYFPDLPAPWVVPAQAEH